MLFLYPRFYFELCFTVFACVVNSNLSPVSFKSSAVVRVHACVFSFISSIHFLRVFTSFIFTCPLPSSCSSAVLFIFPTFPDKCGFSAFGILLPLCLLSLSPCVQGIMDVCFPISFPKAFAFWSKATIILRHQNSNFMKSFKKMQIKSIIVMRVFKRTYYFSDFFFIFACGLNPPKAYPTHLHAPPSHTFMVACMDIYISALPISRQVIYLQHSVNLKSQPVFWEKTFCDMTDLAKTHMHWCI